MGWPTRSLLGVSSDQRVNGLALRREFFPFFVEQVEHRSKCHAVVATRGGLQAIAEDALCRDLGSLDASFGPSLGGRVCRGS